MGDLQLRLPTRLIYLFLPIFDSLPKSKTNGAKGKPVLPADVEARFLELKLDLSEQKYSNYRTLTNKNVEKCLYNQSAPNVTGSRIYKQVQDYIHNKEEELNNLAIEQQNKFKTVEKHSKPAESPKLSFDPLDVAISLKSINIDIIDDLHDTDLMFLRFTIPGLSMTCNAFGSSRMASVVIPLRAAWFNHNSASFEPIIEPVTLVFTA